MPVTIEEWQWSFIFKYLRDSKKTFIAFIVFLFLEISIEIVLLVSSNLYFKKLASVLNPKKALVMSLILLVGLIVYLIVSFLATKNERILIVEFVNRIRRTWFDQFLNKSIVAVTQDDKASLIVKLTYHLSLMQMGLDRTLRGVFNWLFLYIGIIIAAFLTNPKILILSLIILPFSVLLFFIAYYISKYYISREQTASSAVIKHVSLSLFDLSILKNQKREHQALDKLDSLVVVDSYFRVQRNIWMVFVYQVFLAVSILLAILFYVMQFYWPILDVSAPGSFVASAILIGYFSKVFYLALSVGLASVPTKVGTSLSIPAPIKGLSKIIFSKTFTHINFYSNKVRITNKGPYYKDFNFSLSAGDRLSVYGDSKTGRTTLAKMFSGQLKSFGKPWLIKMDGKKYLYKKWVEVFNKNYFIFADFTTEMNVGEFITGQYRTSLETTQIDAVYDLLYKYQDMLKLSLPKLLATDIKGPSFTVVERTLLQILHCIYTRPSIIVIDNLIIDLNNERINQMLKVLDQELKNSIIVIFSKEKNDILVYNNTYEINQDEKKIKKI